MHSAASLTNSPPSTTIGPSTTLAKGIGGEGRGGGSSTKSLIKTALILWVNTRFYAEGVHVYCMMCENINEAGSTQHECNL